MKKFIIKLLYFMSPILLFGYSFDVFISKNLKKSNSFAASEYSVWNNLIKGKINSDIVIYGSSTAWVHFSPKIISEKLETSTYNLGVDGHNFWIQHLRHKQLLKYNKKPKLIIYAVDHITLQKNTELYNFEQFLPYMLWNDDFMNVLSDKGKFGNFDYNIPLLRYCGRYNSIKEAFEMSIFKKDNKIKRINGYQGQEKTWNNDFDNAEKKTGSLKIILDSLVKINFEIFLKECKSESIKVILVYTPEFIEGQKFIKNKSEIIKIYYDLSKKHSISFYDFSNDRMSFNKFNFYNTKHLNKIGAELFSNQYDAPIFSDRTLIN